MPKMSSPEERAKKRSPQPKSKGKKKGKALERKKPTFTEEQRQKQRENAQRLVAEGRLGGAKFGKLGGRPRKRRASEIVAEEAERHGKEIAQVFKDSIQSHMPIRVRLEGARGWLDVENREAALQLEEEKELENTSREDLIGEIKDLLTDPVLAASVQTIDGEAEEVTDADVIGDADGNGGRGDHAGAARELASSDAEASVGQAAGAFAAARTRRASN